MFSFDLSWVTCEFSPFWYTQQTNILTTQVKICFLTSFHWNYCIGSEWIIFVYLFSSNLNFNVGCSSFFLLNIKYNYETQNSTNCFFVTVHGTFCEWTRTGRIVVPNYSKRTTGCPSFYWKISLGIQLWLETMFSDLLKFKYNSLNFECLTKTKNIPVILRVPWSKFEANRPTGFWVLTAIQT